jgi:MHS family shikimate/dehydroshikimate transporter-like MFS transporter
MLDTKNPVLIVLAIVIAQAFFKTAISAVQGTWFCELFSSSVRYTSFAVGREYPSIIGGLMPTIGSAVLIWSGGKSWAISVIIVVFALLALIGVLIGPENSKLDLKDIDARGSKEKTELNTLV